VAFRIQRTDEERTVLLTVSGALTDEYVVELERILAAEAGVQPVAMDLTEVTHVTRGGVRLLARLEVRGVRVVGCPEYLRQWISREREFLVNA
jgi:ABC-type transporter Mla MlaB component